MRRSPFLLLVLLACQREPAVVGPQASCDPAACGEHASCGPDGRCACAPGWVGDGTSCADADECAIGAHDCAPQAACENTEGGFVCTCGAGWEGDGTRCDDVDECAAGSHDCDANARCANTAGGFACTCLEGWAGDGRICADVDECATGAAACHARATCENAAGGYTCACEPPFAGDGFDCRGDFAPSERVGHALDGTPGPVNAAPALDGDGAGNVILVYGDHGAGIHGRRWDASTRTWSESAELHDVANHGHLPRLAVDAAGNALVAWNLSNDFEATGIAVRPYDSKLGWPDGWGEIETVAVLDSYGQIGVRFLDFDANGNSIVGWEQIEYDGQEFVTDTRVRIRKASEGTWGDEVVVPEAVANPAFALRSEGGAMRLLVAWEDGGAIRSLEGSWNPDADGWNWGEADLHTVSGALPRVAWDAGGNVYVAYLDVPGWGEPMLHVRQRGAGGVWSDPFEVERGTPYMEELQLVGGADGEAMVAYAMWEETTFRGMAARFSAGDWTKPARVDLHGGAVWRVLGAMHEDGRCLLAWSERTDGDGAPSAFARSCDGDALGPVWPLEQDDELQHVFPVPWLGAEDVGAVAWTARTGPSDDPNTRSTIEVAFTEP